MPQGDDVANPPEQKNGKRRIRPPDDTGTRKSFVFDRKSQAKLALQKNDIDIDDMKRALCANADETHLRQFRPLLMS